MKVYDRFMGTWTHDITCVLENILFLYNVLYLFNILPFLYKQIQEKVLCRPIFVCDMFHPLYPIVCYFSFFDAIVHTGFRVVV